MFYCKTPPKKTNVDVLSLVKEWICLKNSISETLPLLLCSHNLIVTWNLLSEKGGSLCSFTRSPRCWLSVSYEKTQRGTLTHLLPWAKLLTDARPRGKRLDLLGPIMWACSNRRKNTHKKNDKFCSANRCRPRCTYVRWLHLIMKMKSISKLHHPTFAFCELVDGL